MSQRTSSLTDSG